MKRMLLFVEDNATLLHVLSRSFSDYFDVVGFASSEEALSYIEVNRDKLDIVLSDYKMPNYTGIQVLEKAKTVKDSTVRILFTGYADIDEVRDGEAVYDAVIDKNVLKDTNEIIKIIKDVTTRKVNK